ncbi:hypothetical protein ACWF2L_31035 [Streptomyces anulatus]
MTNPLGEWGLPCSGGAEGRGGPVSGQGAGLEVPWSRRHRERLLD